MQMLGRAVDFKATSPTPGPPNDTFLESTSATTQEPVPPSQEQNQSRRYMALTGRRWWDATLGAALQSMADGYTNGELFSAEEELGREPN